MTESSYVPGETIENVARNDYRGIWQAARDGKLDAAESYETATYTAIQVTLSGGGPGADLVFVLTDPLEAGGEVREGFFSYYEADGSHVIPFGARDGQMMLDALTGVADEEPDDESDDEGDTLARHFTREDQEVLLRSLAELHLYTYADMTEHWSAKQSELVDRLSELFRDVQPLTDNLVIDEMMKRDD